MVLVFLWNAGGIRGCLADFRRFGNKYRFPIIALLESRVEKHFWLSGYVLFQSNNFRGRGRVLLVLRKDLTYIQQTASPHCSNEYIAMKIAHISLKFTLITAYIQPGVSFDASRFTAIL